MAAPNLGRQPPDAPAPCAHLPQLFLGELQNAVGRVCANSLQRVRGTLSQPFEAVGLFDPVHAPFFNYRRKTSKQKVSIN